MSLYIRVLAILSVCLTYCSLTSSMISFKARTLTFFVNDDIKAGKLLATIQARGAEASISYSITSSNKLQLQKVLTIGGPDGKITLRKDLKLFLRLRKDGTRRLFFRATACIKLKRRKRCRRINVRIIALKRNFGDQFVEDALKQVSPEQLVNHLFKGVTRKVITPTFLFRFLRRPPKTSEEIEITQAQQDAAIQFVKKKIEKIFSISSKQNISFNFLHIEKIFSLNKIAKLLNPAKCKSVENIARSLTCYYNIYRTYDGTCNNLYHRHWGAADIKLERMIEPEYTDPDRLYLPKGSPDEFYKSDLPTASKVSHYFIGSQTHARPSHERYSHAVMQWGQFLDHDVGLSPESENADKCSELPCDGSLTESYTPCFPIPPANNASRCIKMTRSAAVCQADERDIQAREQINVLTSYVDGSQIYGSSESLAKRLRTGKDGLLRMSKKNLLILDTEVKGHPVDLCTDMGGCFLSGDGRVNEQIGLASMHTLFNREHNRIAVILKQINRHWDDEKLFQEARKIVGAILQKITYEDWLTKILGRDGLLPFAGYQYDVNPGILNEFSTAAFRFGHSLIRPLFDVLDNGYNPMRDPMSLKEIFFNNVFIQKHGIEPPLLGLLANTSQDVDPFLAEGLTKHLFERAHTVGLNLASLNIQRGRDHGLSGYNTYRKLCGMKSAETFEDTALEIKNAGYRELLEKLYKTPENVDLWVAGLAEDPLPDSAVGPTFHCIISKQFQNLRDGDRYYYEEKDVFTRNQLQEIKRVTLSQIMCHNLNGMVSIQRDAFIAPSCEDARVSCDRILKHSINLEAWAELAPCYSNPCEHGGHCVPIDGGKSFHCFCGAYWTGDRCQYHEYPCNPSICVNPHDMWCRSQMRGAYFACSHTFFAPRKNYDYCKDNPCPKGYSCSKENDGYYGGYSCERTDSLY